MRLTEPTFTIYNVDCLDVLRTMEANSIDSIVTDPPYGLNFMNRDWDKALPSPDIWKECLRVLKPGGHMVAFGAPKLYHRLACSIEDQGFEIRDSLMWIFGTGFPKSLDISKAIDKAAGAERDVIGRYKTPDGGKELKTFKNMQHVSLQNGTQEKVHKLITKPASDEAVQWNGWGTALKPAYEPIILARKPLEGTVASNILKYKTGGLNIDKCRIEIDSTSETTLGRWPANLILNEEAGALLDAQSGISKSTQGKPRKGAPGTGYGMTHTGAEYSDMGGASRFFYCSKASKKEREAGLSLVKDVERKNTHPTVKPISLMRWLVRLITPPEGTVLDPFAGSGSTGCAAVIEGFNFVGCELEEEYATIATKRIEHVLSQNTQEEHS